MFLPETLKYWFGLQRGRSYLVGRIKTIGLVKSESDFIVTSVETGLQR